VFYRFWDFVILSSIHLFWCVLLFSAVALYEYMFWNAQYFDFLCCWEWNLLSESRNSFQLIVIISYQPPLRPVYTGQVERQGKWTSILLQVTCFVWTLTCLNFEARQVIKFEQVNVNTEQVTWSKILVHFPCLASLLAPCKPAFMLFYSLLCCKLEFCCIPWMFCVFCSWFWHSWWISTFMCFLVFEMTWPNNNVVNAV
jgi:hypothetical protein